MHVFHCFYDHSLFSFTRVRLQGARSFILFTNPFLAPRIVPCTKKVLKKLCDWLINTCISLKPSWDQVFWEIFCHGLLASRLSWVSHLYHSESFLTKEFSLLHLLLSLVYFHLGMVCSFWRKKSWSRICLVSWAMLCAHNQLSGPGYQ